MRSYNVSLDVMKSKD